MNRSSLARALVASVALSGCYRVVHGVPDAATDAGCDASAPVCVARGDDPCAAPHAVTAVCDGASWRCPDGSREHRRAASAPTSCLPFHDDPSGALAGLGGSLVRVPVSSTQCLWIAEDARTTAGETVRNVGFDVDADAFGQCPSRAVFHGGAMTDLVRVEGGDDPTLRVQISGGYRVGAETRVMYRMFRADPAAVFGLTELGTGLGRWDAASGRIVVLGPARLRWSSDVDLGDAHVAIDGYHYLWGCPRTDMYLLRGCVVGRVDARDATTYWRGAEGWSATLPTAEAEVMGSGPWLSSVVRDDATHALTHVFIGGFGTRIQSHVANAPEGPWRDGRDLAACEVPSGDMHAYCAGPVVHEELTDPTRPDEIAVSYALGTTDPNTAVTDRDAWWPRLAWVRRAP